MADLFELKLTDSPFPQAMDIYYDQLSGLVNCPSKQKVALVSNLSLFPIRPTTRLYDKFVSRSFADRSVETGSPEAIPSTFLGPASFADAFSSQYKVLLDRAMASVDVKMAPEQRVELELSRRRVAETQAQQDALLDLIFSEWEKFKTAHYSGKDDDDLILERISWFSTHRLARQLESFMGQVDRELTLQQAIADKVGDEETSLIYRLSNNYANDTVYLCKVWQLEEARKLDELAMSDPLKMLGSIAWADKGLDIDSIIDFDAFLKLPGLHALDIGRNLTTTSSHEQSWGASASFHFNTFFSGNVNAEEHTKMTASLKDTMNLHFGFDRIDQVWIKRGDWYSSALFNLPSVQKLLSADKRLASSLKYVVSSIIIARGLKLKLAFDHVEQASYFHQYSAGGSASILGIIPVGSGQAGGTDQSTSFLEKEKAVEFADDSQLSRILGFTVEKLHDIRTDEQLRTDHGLFLSAAEAVALLSATYDFTDMNTDTVALSTGF